MLADRCAAGALRHGAECAVLPTAILRRTRFEGFRYEPLSLTPVADHWQQQPAVRHDLHRYLGRAQVIRRSTSRASRHAARGLVMADHGALYAGLEPDFPAVLRTLCAQADLITPNITEACLLTGLEYRETHDDSYIRTLLERLLALGARTAILTGVRTEPGRVGVACMDAAGAVSQCSAPYVPAVFYGTGDLFASTCAGALTLGWSVHDAMELASAYVADTIAETRREPDARWYGVSFEATIPQLLRRMAQRRPSHAEN
ncbi:MAG: bifunctional hydroxymethylpyrimidine kinase/phosphomethylpyrimidine kinase [Oscillospiraceae bacterium]